MASNPSHVRLPNRLIRGCVVDLTSGWSLSGLDVAEFPSDEYPAAQEFVRRALRENRLEPADKSEYQKVNGDHLDLLARTGVQVEPLTVQASWQAAQHHALATDIRLGLEGDRFGDTTSNYEADQARREAILKARKAADGKGARGAAKAQEAQDEANQVGADSPVNPEDPAGRANQSNDGSQKQPAAPGGKPPKS